MAERPNEDPEKRTGRSPDLTWSRFILVCEQLVESGSKYKACEALGFDYSTVRNAIKAATDRGDDEWQELWDSSYDQFRQSLEDAAITRARDGIATEFRVDARTGERIPIKVEYSDRLMEVLLKGHFPERFRERIHVSGTMGLEPVDAFANLTLPAKRAIRDIIMRDLEEQRHAAAQRQIEAEYTEVAETRIEDLSSMKLDDDEEDGK